MTTDRKMQVQSIPRLSAAWAAVVIMSASSRMINLNPLLQHAGRSTWGGYVGEEKNLEPKQCPSLCKVFDLFSNDIDATIV